MNVETTKNSTVGATVFVAHLRGAASNIPPDRVPRQMPVAIPRSQLYYWTSKWQDGETQSLEDLRAGKTKEFTDFKELTRYLLSTGE